MLVLGETYLIKIEGIFIRNIKKKKKKIPSIFIGQEGLGEKKWRGWKLELEKAAHAEKFEEYIRVISENMEGWWRDLQGEVKRDTKLIEKIDKKDEKEVQCELIINFSIKSEEEIRELGTKKKSKE